MIFRILIAALCLFSIHVKAQVNQKKADSLKAVIALANAEDKTEAYVKLIEVFEYKENDSADFYTRKLIQYGKTTKQLKPEIRGLLIKAKFFIQTSNYDSAHIYYDKAWTQLENFEDYQLKSIYYGDQGVLNFYQGDFKLALENFSNALELAKSNKKKDDVLTFLNNKALAMSYLGQAEASIDVHEEAIDLAKELKDSTALGRSLNNLGLIYEDMDALEKALEFYEKALVIKEKHGTPQDILNGKYNVANMHRELAEDIRDTVMLNKSEAEFENLILEAEEENYGKLVLFAKTALAQVATSKGQFERAIELYKPVIDGAIAQKDNQTLRVVYLNVGSNYFELENYQQAKYYLELAEPFIVQAENPSDSAKLFKNLAKTYYELGEFKKAYEYSNNYLESSKTLIDEDLQEKITDFEVKYETEKKENQILEQRAQLAEKDLEVRRKNAFIYGSLALAFILGLLGYLIYSRQKLKNSQLQKEHELQVALAKIETQNRLQEQRLRISRDLHDNIGSQLTFIISSIDNLKYRLKDADSVILDKLSSISAFTSTTINELRDTIWAMNKEKISVEDLQTRISNFIERAQSSKDSVQFSFDFNTKRAPDFIFTSIEGVNIYRVIQEAVNNALKYAGAQNIQVTMQVWDADQFKVAIIDDGNGFDLKNHQQGNGLGNMKKRAQDIGATLQIETQPTQGTRVILQSK